MNEITVTLPIDRYNQLLEKEKELDRKGIRVTIDYVHGQTIEFKPEYVSEPNDLEKFEIIKALKKYFEKCQGMTINIIGNE